MTHTANRVFLGGGKFFLKKGVVGGLKGMS